MTRRAFFIRYRDVDAILVAASWRLFLEYRSRWDLRQKLLDDLDELRNRATIAQYEARRDHVLTGLDDLF